MKGVTFARSRMMDAKCEKRADLKLDKELEITKMPKFHAFSSEVEMILLNMLPVFQRFKHAGMPMCLIKKGHHERQ
jgi:hypothetical protein